MAADTSGPSTVARALLRSLAILVCAAAVVVSALLWLGPPTVAREYHVRNEVARFAPTLGHGFIQLGGEAFLLALVAYVGRRWLRIRL